MNLQMTHHLMAALIGVVFTAELYAQPTTTFTYQGQFVENGIPATGLYDFKFTLYDSNEMGTLVGGPLTNNATLVNNGLFTVTLDFGAGVFDGSDRWLELGVATNGGGTFSTLSPRQQLASTPYAVRALNLGSNALSAFSGPVSFSNPANSFSGTFSGDGSALTNVGGISASNSWQLGGNSGTTAGVNFIGTKDGQALELKVDGWRGWRLEPTVTDAAHSNIVNVVGGSEANAVGPGTYGATISGGGAADYLGAAGPNRVDAAFGTIAGGFYNSIHTNAGFSSIGGGSRNTILEGATFANIGAGWVNVIESGASRSTIGGGWVNRVGTNAELATIGGGWGNRIEAGAMRSTIGGGWGNTIEVGSMRSTIGGGWANTIMAGASNSVIGGGERNSVFPNADHGTVPGGELNAANSYGFAAGRRAKANHFGAFVWADGQDAAFTSTTTNQFNVRAFGGVRFETSGGGMTLDGADVLAGAVPGSALSGLYTNAVTFSNPSNAFSGDGSGLTALNAAELTGTIPASALGDAWQLGGNAGTTAGANFLGTTDNQALELKVNGSRAWRMEPTAEDANHLGIVNVLGGSRANTIASGVYGAVIGGGGAVEFLTFSGTNRVSADFGTIGGGLGNSIESSARYSTIGGGLRNTVQDSSAYTTIGGGLGNSIEAGVMRSTIGGGWANTIEASANNSTIAGGQGNRIQFEAVESTIGGGWANRIENYAWRASVGGGYLNRIQASSWYATIGGGHGNTIELYSDAATIGGGELNTIQQNAKHARIGGGELNLVETNANHASIGGGEANAIQVNADYSTVGGGSGNRIESSALESTIGGGRDNVIGTNAFGAVIGGGRVNAIELGAFGSTIPGGLQNRIRTSAGYATVGGGNQNWIETAAYYSTIAGGFNNRVHTNAESSSIGGGTRNGIEPDATYSTIGGGRLNSVAGGAAYSVIGGGGTNAIAANAEAATIAGGSGNNIGIGSGWSAIAGGSNNDIGDNSQYATIGGGRDNDVGENADYAHVSGRRAKANHTGAFMWADSQNADFSSARADEFAVRASGGMRLVSGRGISLNAADKPIITRGWDAFDSTDPDKAGHGRWGLFMESFNLVAGIPNIPSRNFQVAKYDTDGTRSELMRVDSVGNLYTTGAVNPPSDRSMKQDFKPVNGEEVLARVAAMPITSWAYKASPETRHVGPVAQDFRAAFAFGTDDKHIATVDADGVALAAIQGLNQKLEQKETEIAELRQTVNELKELMQEMNNQLNGGAQ